MASQTTQSPKMLIQKLEPDAAKVVQEMMKSDQLIYQNDGKVAGDRYLNNKSTITKTEGYKLASEAPKGGHLHIHFNSCLGPNVLLAIAAEDAIKNNMYISTNVPGALTKDNLSVANIQFHFLGADQKKVKSVFDPKYQGRKTPTDDVETYDKMIFQDFLAKFQTHIGIDAFPQSMQNAVGKSGSKALAMRWLQQKLVFSANQVTYEVGSAATVAKQWDIFNARTQMMKGLFNYEHAYRRYTQLLLAEFVKENIQYAEIRPNFMKTNQVFKSSNPKEKMDNFDIMNLIISEYTNFHAKNPGFGGLKVIYCTPRSFDTEKIKWSLDECLAMKKDPKIGNYIAGFDVIGPENKPNGLKYFEKVFRQFQADCKQANVVCPFLFHAGESHDDPDGNLNVAMALGSKRIAHGFSIPKNNAVKAWAKEKRVCVECCPISNEILGLGPSIKDAVVYKLMAAGIPCALASDNPTLFSSNLSYDFYQFMIGDPNFTLSKWRKLMEDSLTHAVWNNKIEKERVEDIWRRRYVTFLQNILKRKTAPTSVADKKQGQANSSVTRKSTIPTNPAAAGGVTNNNIPRTNTLPTRPAVASAVPNGPGTAATGTKVTPSSQQVQKTSKQPSAKTTPEQTNKATKTTQAKPVIKKKL